MILLYVYKGWEVLALNVYVPVILGTLELCKSPLTWDHSKLAHEWMVSTKINHITIEKYQMYINKLN